MRIKVVFYETSASMGLWTVLLFATIFSSNATFAQSIEEFDDDQIISDDSADIDKTNDLKGKVNIPQAVSLMIEQTNQFRRKHELEPVTTDDNLEQAAATFAKFMAETGKYGHTADGNRPSQRAKEKGYAFCIVSENIAYQYRSTAYKTAELVNEFVEGWKNSPGHRKNMLDPDVREIGVGLARSKSGYYFAVQMFGRPQSASIEFTVANRTGEEATYRLITSKNRPDDENQPAKKQQAEAKSFTLPPHTIAKHRRCRPPFIKLGADEKSPDNRRQRQPVDAGDTFGIRKKGEKREIIEEDPSGK